MKNSVVSLPDEARFRQVLSAFTMSMLAGAIGSPAKGVYDPFEDSFPIQVGTDAFDDGQIYGIGIGGYANDVMRVVVTFDHSDDEFCNTFGLVAVIEVEIDPTPPDPPIVVSSEVSADHQILDGSFNTGQSISYKHFL